MISSVIGLQTAIAMGHNATYGLLTTSPMTKQGAIARANFATMQQISQAQQNYYRKLIHKNIKNSFNIFA